jgi:hypothetical protein
VKVRGLYIFTCRAPPYPWTASFTTPTFLPSLPPLPFLPLTGHCLSVNYLVTAGLGKDSLYCHLIL